MDSDSSKDELERTVLKYSVYKDGKWSNPVAVQNDGTADFQPSICAMNDGKVMISWLSSDPADEKSGEAADYLSYLEVYTAGLLIMMQKHLYLRLHVLQQMNIMIIFQ